jgi:putative transposase
VEPKGDERLPFFGVPVKIRTDHGYIYESGDFLEALLRLDVVWDPAPQACPGANGRIERWFQTFSNGLLTTLRGYSDQFRGLSKAKELALPESALPGLIQKYVIRYNHTVHSEIGCTPFERWMERMGTVHGLAVPPEIVEQAIRVRQEATVERDGVHLYGLHFMSEELVGLVGEKVIVRVPIDATATEVECFGRSGGRIGVLRPVDHDRDLAAQINAARLGRTIEIQSLAKTLREIAGHAPAPEPEKQPSILPDTVLETPIRPAPKLSIEE